MICLQMGKTYTAKPNWVILSSPFLRIHCYRNKWLQVKEAQYLIPTYSWTLTPIPNWTCSVVTISHFQCIAPSTWLTNSMHGSKYVTNHQLEKDVGCKVLQFINTMKIVRGPFSVAQSCVVHWRDDLTRPRFFLGSCIWNSTLGHVVQRIPAYF